MTRTWTADSSRGGAISAESFGYDVLGPVVAEFCLRLWTLTEQLERSSDTAVLFCARGGLRMQLAYERFLAAAGLTSSVELRSLMISRLVAVRPVLARTTSEGLERLLPSAAAALSREFVTSSLGEVARAVSGVDPVALAGSTARIQLAQPFTPQRLADLLRSPAGRPLAEALEEQSQLFTLHLRHQLAGRSHALLVDTGLYGTTRDLLSESGLLGKVSCALIARSFRPGIATDHRTYGLSMTARDYSPLQRRTALLRYWHLIEWLFEPDLPSVHRFDRDGVGSIASDLEVPGWQERVAPDPKSVFAGVLAHLDDLPNAPAAVVVQAAGQAWSELHRAIVAPRPEHGFALAVATRSHGFGREETWEQGEVGSVWQVLRSNAMWREGQIARSGTRLRVPVLAAMTMGYATRNALRAARRRFG